MKTSPILTYIVSVVILSLISCGGKKLPANSVPLLKISIENMEGLDKKNWSDLTVIDGKNARILSGDEAALFSLPTWWGTSTRPNEGEIFVLEIDYKDVTSDLFIVSSFGNCASILNRFSELHRISCENSNSWKTAFIPVSWDYLYAGAGNPAGSGKQVFNIKLSNGNQKIPVSEFRIRKATSEDEIRYNAETREWVKKSQSKYLVTDSTSAAQLSDSWKSKEAVPYLRNYLIPILPSDAPETGEAGVPMRIRMAKNEIECRQLGVYANGTDLQGVSISISDLKNDKGELLNAKTNLFTVEYAIITGRNGMPKTDAQRIWPVFETPVKKGYSQAFWLTFETEDKSANPGLYKGDINILIKGKTTARVPLEIEVMPITLLTMDEAGLSMGGCVTGLIPFHDIKYALQQNVNSTNLWFASVRPDMKKIDGKLVLDFTLIDEWMKEAKRLGMQNIVYFLGGNPYGFPRTMGIERELFVVMQDEGTVTERTDKYLKLAADKSNRGYILKEIRGVYSQWVREVSEHAINNGWPELIFTPFDEPAKHEQKPYRKESYENDDKVIGTGPWIKSHFEDGCDIIRRSAMPGTRIYGSIHAASGIEFLPVINVFCTNAIDEDPALGDKVRAAGNTKHFWQYTGVSSGSEPANIRYSFGFYFGAFNSRGSLLWAYNWGGRFNTTEGYNWMICWDTPFSTIPTLSYEGLREAWDDRRYIETLRKTAKSKEEETEIQLFLDNIFSAAIKTKSEGGDDTVNDFWNKTRVPEKLDEWRSMIADKIIKMSN